MDTYLTLIYQGGGNSFSWHRLDELGGVDYNLDCASDWNGGESATAVAAKGHANTTDLALPGRFEFEIPNPSDIQTRKSVPNFSSEKAHAFVLPAANEDGDYNYFHTVELTLPFAEIKKWFDVRAPTTMIITVTYSDNLPVAVKRDKPLFDLSLKGLAKGLCTSSTLAQNYGNGFTGYGGNILTLAQTYACEIGADILPNVKIGVWGQWIKNYAWGLSATFVFISRQFSVEIRTLEVTGKEGEPEGDLSHQVETTEGYVLVDPIVLSGEGSGEE